MSAGPFSPLPASVPLSAWQPLSSWKSAVPCTLPVAHQVSPYLADTGGALVTTPTEHSPICVPPAMEIAPHCGEEREKQLKVWVWAAKGKGGKKTDGGPRGSSHTSTVQTKPENLTYFSPPNPRQKIHYSLKTDRQ